MKPRVYVVTDRAGRVLARESSPVPLTHAVAARRFDGRTEILGWGSREHAHAAKAKALGRVEIRAAVVVGTSIERRALR